MKSLRTVLVVPVALAALSAAPSGAPQPNEANPAEAAPPRDNGQDALRRMFTDLAEDNVKLRKENDLRADNDALQRRLEECEKLLRQQRDNRRGAFVLPQEGFQGQLKNAVPKDWKPFEFNGATYYLVPLASGDDAGAKPANAMQVTPARPAKLAAK